MNRHVTFIVTLATTIATGAICFEACTCGQRISLEKNDQGQSTPSLKEDSNSATPSVEPAKPAERGFPKQHFYKVFIGTLAGLPILMRLYRFDDELHGWYTRAPVYVEQDYENYLSGSLDADGKFSLRGVDDDGKMVGVFTGKLSIGSTRHRQIMRLQGEWTSGKRKRRPFFLAEQYLALPQGMMLTTKEIKEEHSDGIYWIQAQYPILKRTRDSAAEKINSTMEHTIETAVNEFKKENQNIRTDDKLIGLPLFLDIDYEIKAANQQVLSVLLTQNIYAGGAHPYDQAITLNFDLKTGEIIEMAELFNRQTDYLKPIALHCERFLAKSLKRQGATSGLGEGAHLEETDLKNWNLIPDGLIFTFDSYEVAAYGFGRQQGFVPFHLLGQIINKDNQYLLRFGQTRFAAER